MNQSLQLPHPRILALLIAMAYRQSEKDGTYQRSSYSVGISKPALFAL